MDHQAVLGLGFPVPHTPPSLNQSRFRTAHRSSESWGTRRPNIVCWQLQELGPSESDGGAKSRSTRCPTDFDPISIRFPFRSLIRFRCDLDPISIRFRSISDPISSRDPIISIRFRSDFDPILSRFGFLEANRSIRFWADSEPPGRRPKSDGAPNSRDHFFARGSSRSARGMEGNSEGWILGIGLGQLLMCRRVHASSLSRFLSVDEGLWPSLFLVQKQKMKIPLWGAITWAEKGLLSGPSLLQHENGQLGPDNNPCFVCASVLFFVALKPLCWYGFHNSVGKQTNLAQIITFEMTKLGPNNISTAYIYML